jgi:hypothetical protein
VANGTETAPKLMREPRIVGGATPAAASMPPPKLTIG